MDLRGGLVEEALRAQSTVGGVWEILLDTQTGETVWTATFEQDGGTLSGEVDIGDRMILPLTGTVDGAGCWMQRQQTPWPSCLAGPSAIRYSRSVRGSELDRSTTNSSKGSKVSDEA